MICKKCNIYHGGNYGSGKFCSSKCARSYSSSNDNTSELKDATCVQCGIFIKINKRASITNAKCNKCKRPGNIHINSLVNKCDQCGTSTKGKTTSFCNTTCSYLYKYYIWLNKYKLNLISGISGKRKTSTLIKKFLFIKYNSQCSICGQNAINPKTNTTPLHVHHVDGDYTNNSEENLNLLCPNCHSITPNFGSLNMGKSTRKFKK